MRWNQRMNLTALSGAGLVRRLVAEPVWIARELSLGGSLVDIGSGNGSPAVPFLVVCGFEECHLVEARTKRAAFLRHLGQTLELPSMIVHRRRLEDGAEEIKKPDWISLQAVALDQRLFASIRRIAIPTTRIIWITSSEAKSVLPPLRVLSVPITGTQVFLYRLDLS
jgi:16S rRNA (guanine527-N7)-methyltransferase